MQLLAGGRPHQLKRKMGSVVGLSLDSVEKMIKQKIFPVVTTA